MQFMIGHRVGLSLGLATPATLADISDKLGIDKEAVRRACYALRDKGAIRYFDKGWE